MKTLKSDPLIHRGGRELEADSTAHRGSSLAGLMCSLASLHLDCLVSMPCRVLNMFNATRASDDSYM